ncbi:MAG TPA: hypothetical protein VHS58_18835 [Acetobacteraceae bacterium]|jgi:hypothetical protein|nr:hypothetical protein [Acetobacteraceae bacterium]
MPGFLLQVGATVICAHGGQAQPTVPNPRILLSGAPSVTLAAPWVIAGCPFVPVAPLPCVTAQWLVGTTRVFSNGQPLLVQSSQAICAPTGAPLLPLAMQTRVVAM